MRTTHESDRWQAIVSAAARGDALSDHDAAYLEDFVAHHPDEASSEPLWTAFAELPETPWAGERLDDDLVRTALTALAQPTELATRPTSTRPWRSRGLLAAATGLLAAGVTVATMVRVTSEPQSSLLVKHAFADAARLEVAPRTDRLAAPSDPRGRTGCTHPQPGFTICLEGNDVQQDEPGTMPLVLRRGRAHVVAERRPHPSNVELSTSLGRLRTETADFTAEFDDDGRRLTVTVMEGRVAAWRDDVSVGVATPGHPLVLTSKARTLTPSSARRVQLAKGRGTQELARAQSFVQQRQIDEAIAVYEGLVERHAGTPESHTAMVTLGRLELDRNRPTAALRWFDRALQSTTGVLEQEAFYGRIRALRAQSLDDAAARATAEFLRTFPGSIYAPRLQRHQNAR